MCGELVWGEIWVLGEVEGDVSFLFGEVRIGGDGAGLGALEGFHEAVGGLVAVAEGVLGFVGEAEGDGVAYFSSGALPEPGGVTAVFDGEFDYDFVVFFFGLLFEALAEGVVADLGLLGGAVKVNVDLVEVLAAAEALEAVVNAVGFTVEHNVEFPEGAFYFYEAVVEGVVVGLLEGEGGFIYGLLADEGDVLPVFSVGVELDGLSPDEGRIRDGGQRILDVGDAVSVGVG